MVSVTIESIHLLNEEVKELCRLALQEQLALDYLLASEGGFCKFIGKKCCTWISDWEDLIEAHLQKIAELKHQARSIAKGGWNPFKGLGNFGNFLYLIGSWLQIVGVYIVMIIICALLIYLLYRIPIYIICRITAPKNHIMLVTPHADCFILWEMPYCKKEEQIK